MGTDHSDTLITRFELAKVRYELGERASALAALHEILGDQTRVLGAGADHPNTLTTRALIDEMGDSG